ncbi:hypothetical protein MKZ38_008486 [Zalerion maritima]|uniref:Uncharacterized protein n=1 Tax=Zalerion maritima TaxID=339359 RepID=A0AAD5WW53_9PEZI|nr:hypothetical protein MKZ38_008486 [Zalerion maritima]
MDLQECNDKTLEALATLVEQRPLLAHLLCRSTNEETTNHLSTTRRELHSQHLPIEDRAQSHSVETSDYDVSCPMEFLPTIVRTDVPPSLGHLDPDIYSRPEHTAEEGDAEFQEANKMPTVSLEARDHVEAKDNIYCPPTTTKRICEPRALTPPATPPTTNDHRGERERTQPDNSGVVAKLCERYENMNPPPPTGNHVLEIHPVPIEETDDCLSGRIRQPVTPHQGNAPPVQRECDEIGQNSSSPT